MLTGIYQPIDSNWDEDQDHYMTINRDFQTGNITSTSLGNVSTEQTYDNYGGLASYEADYGSTPMFQTTYSRDSLDRITSIYETEFGVSKNTDYEYDPVGRLTKVWRNDTLVSQYVYDANGNRIAHITPTSIDSGTYDAQDRMLTYDGTQYLYGPNGELRTKNNGTDTTKYTYDAFGNLTRVVMPNGDVVQPPTAGRYVTDGQNRRIARKLNGRITNKWLYAGQLAPVAELDSADNIVARFSGGYMNERDTIYQIITDHLPSKIFYMSGWRKALIGSPRLVVNVSSGEIVQRIDYDEFGNVIYDSNPGFQPFGFAGGLYDPETKLVRFGARDYDASVGGWTSKDPILFHGGVSNLYEYCVNDPVAYFDPIGQQTFSLGVSVNFQLGPININGSAGIVLDKAGNFGLYATPGGGAGAGAKASGGINASVSNAKTICDLSGPFVNANAGAGEGLDVEANSFTGNSPNGWVTGGGITVGAGLGAGGAAGGSVTKILKVLKLW